MMRVFKFGGASVRDAKGVINLFNIVSEEKDRLVIVISAFGKTTNALENLHLAWRSRDAVSGSLLGEIEEYHLRIAEELFGRGSSVCRKINDGFRVFSDSLKQKTPGDFDHDYDMIVSEGELWSTMIVEAYLRSRGLNSQWLDAIGRHASSYLLP